MIAVLFQIEFRLKSNFILLRYPAKLWPVPAEALHGRVIQNLEKDARRVKGDTFAVTRASLNGESAHYDNQVLDWYLQLMLSIVGIAQSTTVDATIWTALLHRRKGEKAL